MSRKNGTQKNYDEYEYEYYEEEEEEQKIKEIRVNEILPYFDEDYVSDDKDIQKSVKANRKRTFEVRIRQLNKLLPQIQEIWNNRSPLEYYLAYTMKGMDEEELFSGLHDSTFKSSVAREAKKIENLSKVPLSKKVKKQLQADITKAILESQKEAASEEEEDFTEQEDYNDYNYSQSKTTKKGKRKNAKRHKLREPTPSATTEDEDSDVQEAREELQKAVRKIQKTASKNQTNLVKRAIKPQTSTIPCPLEISPEEWATWSDAHKHSYMRMHDNPNTYLYRNLPPGEKQKSGSWTKEETQLFLRRLQEFRSQGIFEGKWGLFSEAIPGRVGYQCSNFYRKLIKDGVVKDELYRTDADGRLHFKERQSYHKTGWIQKNGNPEECLEKTKPKKEKKKDKPKKQKKITEVIQHKKKSQEPGFYDKMAALNPFKDQTDFITGEAMSIPAISPDGTVLDYNTWLHILKTTKEDPFTLSHVNKRQLVILTKDNIDEYRPQIKHM